MPRTLSASSIRLPGVLFVPNSEASKITGCSATYLCRSTCPKQCPFRGDGCYGNSGHVLLHTPEDVDPDIAIANECVAIQAASNRTAPLRLHVVGDVTTPLQVTALVMAASRWHAPVFTYTHSWREIERHWWGNINVFASCETLAEAHAAMRAGYSAALVVEKFGCASMNAGWEKCTPHQITLCRHQHNHTDCIYCRLCFNSAAPLKHNHIIAFEPHGTQAKAVRRIVRAKGEK